MINVDLIVPSLKVFRKIRDIPKTKSMKYQYWFPVWFYKKELKKRGVNIRFLDLFSLKKTKLSKIVGLDSNNPRIVRNYEVLLKKLKKKTDLLIWFDQTDTTGKALFPVLKYVDRYYKRQILKDRSLYNKDFYKNSIYVDYYNRNYNIDTENYRPGGFRIDPKYEKKIGLSWNLSWSDFRFSNKISQVIYQFLKTNTLQFHNPSADRKLLFSANCSIHRGSDLIYFQRKQLFKTLLKIYKSYPNISIGHAPKREYLSNMKNSKAIFSPFGWGEICYRDFEAFIGGAALIKPDMSHLETWPDLYKENETYIPIPWKIEDWEDLIPEILSDERVLLKIAKNGQNNYKKLWTNKGKDLFCNRFIDMVTP